MADLKPAPKPRDPAAHARSSGALRQVVIPNKKRALPRKAKHQKG